MIKHKNIPYRMDENDHKSLKMFCVEKGISMQEFMDRAVREYKQKWVV